MSCSGFKPGWIQIDVSYIIFLVLFDFNYFLTALLFENLSQLRVLVMPRAAWPFSTKMPFQQPPQSFQAKRNLLEEPLFLCVWKLVSQLFPPPPDFRLAFLHIALGGNRNPWWAPAGHGATLGSKKTLLTRLKTPCCYTWIILEFIFFFFLPPFQGLSLQFPSKINTVKYPTLLKVNEVRTQQRGEDWNCDSWSQTMLGVQCKLFSACTSYTFAPVSPWEHALVLDTSRSCMGCTVGAVTNPYLGSVCFARSPVDKYRISTFSGLQG